MKELYFVRHKVYPLKSDECRNSNKCAIAECYVLASNGTEAINLVRKDMHKIECKPAEVFEEAYILDTEEYDEDDYDSKLIEYAKRGRIMYSVFYPLPE